MLVRILRNSLRKRPKAVLLVLLSIVMGSIVATAFLGLAGEVAYKMALELRSYGANILLEPAAGEEGELREEDLPRIKTVFWKYNIVGFAPYLFGIVDFTSAAGQERGVVAGTWFAKEMAVPGEEPSVQGITVTAPWMEVAGHWPQGANEVVIGAALAQRLRVAAGDQIVASQAGKKQAFTVVGIVATGGYEEEQVFAPLVTVQGLLGRPGALTRVLVSALTVPMDDFGRKTPATMTKEEYEIWYCTAYVTAIAKSLEEVVAGSRAKPIWQIASAEGSLLTKLNGIMLLLTVLALAAAAIAVSSSLIASMAERAPEIAQMKMMGADRMQIAAIFLGETLLLALVGGLAGYLVGDQVAGVISRTIFDSDLRSTVWLFPTAILSALAVAVAGSIAPLRRALRIEPVRVLKG